MGLIKKTWNRCKSFSPGRSSENIPRAPKKSKSWPRITAAAAAASLEDDKRVKKGRVAPEGCFSVYVGPEKQRFVIKTEYANHPLFKILLEEAELEYGYNSEGPLALPCNVEIFHKVLLEMDSSDKIHQGCTFPRSHSSYRLLSPSPMIAMNHF
ncbi:hypothetical protein AAG906_004145 [Vitis piasezkii]